MGSLGLTSQFVWPKWEALDQEETISKEVGGIPEDDTQCCLLAFHMLHTCMNAYIHT